METPGDALIASIMQSMRGKGAQLSKGELVLTLNPSCVAFLGDLFTTFEKTFSFGSTHSHAELADMYSFILRLPSLQLRPSFTDGSPEPSFDLTHFHGLTSLQLLDLDPEVAIVPGALRARLRHLAVRGTLHSCSAYFPLESGAGAATAMAWPALERLDLSHNFVRDLSDSAVGTHLTGLTALDLSHNLLLRVPVLNDCVALQSLTLSCNRITEVTTIKNCVGGITSLALQGNKLVSTAGLQYLMALELLDLRDNSITDWEDVHILRRLSFLAHLWLKGNPVAESAGYRLEVFRTIVLGNAQREAPTLWLDGAGASRAEQDALRTLQLQIPIGRPRTSSSSSSSVSAPAIGSVTSAPSASSLSQAAELLSSSSGSSSLSSSVPSPVALNALQAKAKKKHRKKPVAVLEPPMAAKRLLFSDSETAATVAAALAAASAEVPTTPSAASATAAQVDAEEEVRFAEKVKQLHAEYSSKWLVVLDGLEVAPASNSSSSGGGGAVKATPRRKKSGLRILDEAVTPPPASASARAPTIVVVATMETETEVVVVSEPPPRPAIMSPVAAVASSSSFVVPRSASASPRALPSVAPVVVSSTSLPSAGAPLSGVLSRLSGKGSRKSAHVEAELIVYRQDRSTGEYTVPRILMVTSAGTFVEADADTGETVVTLRGSDLVAVDEIEMMDGALPLIKMDFVSNGEERRIPYCCRPAEAADAATLLQLARQRCTAHATTTRDSSAAASSSSAAGTVASVASEGNTRCIRCNHVFSAHGENVPACPACKSEFVVAIASRRPSRPEPVDETLRARSSSQPMQLQQQQQQPQQLPFLGPRDLPHGLDLQIIVDSGSEAFLCLLRCDVATVSERAPSEADKPLWVMATSERLYVLAQAAAYAHDTQAGCGFSTQAVHAWSGFSRITLGLFMTWLRFDLAAGQPNGTSLLLLTNSHARTHRLLDLLRGSARALPPCVQTVRPYIAALQRVLGGSSVRVLSYARVSMRRKRTLLWDALDVKSLVLTADALALLDEDFGRWFGAGPNVAVSTRLNIVDVAAVALEGALVATIEFDSDVVRSVTWGLTFASADDRRRFVDALSACWGRHMGGIALPIKE